MTKKIPNFVTCHCHQQSLDSASTPEAFAKREIELGTGYVTVTDHGTLGACRKVYDLAKEHSKNGDGLTPIIGIEAYFRDDNCPIFAAAGIAKNEAGKYVDYFKYGHVTIHCLDYPAYATLVRLLSKADARAEKHGQERKPLFTWADLEEIGAQNVTMTTGCLIGMVQRHLLDNNDPRMALAYYDRLRSICKPGNFYVELFPHVCDRDFVSGIFLTFEDGTKVQYYDKKKLRTTLSNEIEAKELVKSFRRNGDKEEFLIGVKNFHTWNEQDPVKLVKVEKIEDFIMNECRPWAPDGDLQRGCNEFMLRAARKYGDKILIGDDSHFAHPEEKVVQDVRLMASGGHWRFATSYHRQDSAEAFAYFQSKMGMSEKDFEGMVEGTYEWAERFKNFKFETSQTLPTKFYPQDTLRHTMSLIKKHGRMDWSNQTYVERLTAEIKLLHQNGTLDFLPYFFVAEEVCSLYEEAGELTGPGRGSAAGLSLAYFLGITHIDPHKYGLSMERFITIDRILSGKQPDIDQDLPSRDLLTDPDTGWLKKRFGDHYAQISVDTTLKLRSSVKDVHRALYGSVGSEVEALTRKFLDSPQGVMDYDYVFGYEDNGTWEKGSLESGKDVALLEYTKRFPYEWSIVTKCLGLPRQKSRHACAFVIANRPIHEFIPLQTISGVLCTSYTAASVEAVGGLKNDYLTINSLKDLADCIRLVQKRYPAPGPMVLNRKKVPAQRLVPAPRNKEHVLLDTTATCACGHLVSNHQHDQQVCASCPCEWAQVFNDVWDLPEDQDVFADVSSGHTETVFQFNTPSAVQWLRHFNHKKPNGAMAIDSIEAMAAFTALDRPGPLEMFVDTPDGDRVNQLVEFARRARGESPAKSLPVFAELFPETYGIMCYQEQLQKLYQHLTGCTLTEAETFRNDVSKKKKKKIIEAHGPFLEKASAKIGLEAAEFAWEFIQTWAEYGFNKSHAVSYVTISYACAYLKHHYPLEWWCAVLRNADKNEVNEDFWRYCGHMIDLPEVSRSERQFEIVNGRIRAPLSLLLGVGEAAHGQIMKYAPYTSLQDFCEKIQLHKENGSKMVTKKITKKKRKTDKVTKVVTITTTTEDVVQKKLGYSAVHRGVVYPLIIAGALDSLFPVADRQGIELTVYDKLQMFERTMSEASGEDLVKVDQKYAEVDQVMRFQMRKAILPAYSEPLLPMLIERELIEEHNGSASMPIKGDWTRYASANEIDRINRTKPWPDGHSLSVAVVAYIESYRKFTYQGHKDAVELVIDVDGGRFKVVKWPDRRTKKLPENLRESCEGAVASLVLSKYKEDRPFAIDEVIVHYEPLKKDKETIPNE